MGNFSTNSFPSNRWIRSDTLSDLAEGIQSIDAAMRHAFGFSTSALTAPFDIADDGSIVVQTSIAIGTSNAMIDIVDEIPASAGANEELKLAHVTAIRNFLDVQRLPGENIDLNTNQFNNNLSGADDTAQKAFDTLDDLPLDNLFHFDESDEFSGVSLDSITATDRIIFEDATDSWGKKYAVVSQLATLVSGYSHTIASHSDTTATGAELEALTDGSETALHIHDGRYYTETELDNGQLDSLYVDIGGDTMTGDLVMDFGTSLQVDVGVMETPTDAVTGHSLGIKYGDSGTTSRFEGSLHQFYSDIEVIDADITLYNEKTILMKDLGGTSRNILSVTDNNIVSVGDAYLDIVIRGSETRPSYDDNIGGFEFLALLSDVITDHGGMGGLSDDDHSVYLLASDATDRATFATNWTDLTDAGDTTLHGHDVTGLTNWPTIDYSYVSGNDAATGITAAELEELSDGSSTSLHTHANIGDGPWLPLSAGSSYALSNDLYINNAANPGLFMSEDSSETTAGRIYFNGSTLIFRTITASGTVVESHDPIPSDGSSSAEVRFFRNTPSGSGSREVIVYAGDATTTERHNFKGSGDAFLSNGAGSLAVGGTSGSEKLSVIGDASFGDVSGGDYAYFGASGHFQMFGEARVWDDLRAPANSLDLGVTAPGPGTFLGNIRTLLFSPSQNQAVHGDFQLPHKYYEGSDVYIHIHWSPMTTNAGSVVWELEYSWANVLGTFPAPTVITVTDPADGTQYKHQLAPFAAISGTGKEISSVIMYRIRRLGTDGADTFTGDAAMLSVDLHYEADTLGSDEEYTK